jgi:hypothetical protein
VLDTQSVVLELMLDFGVWHPTGIGLEDECREALKGGAAPGVEVRGCEPCLEQRQARWPLAHE